MRMTTRQRAQPLRQLGDGGTAQGIGIEAAVHQRDEGGGEAPMTAQRCRGALKLVVAPAAIRLEWSLPASGLIEHSAQAPNVGRRRQESAIGLLGRHVGACANTRMTATGAPR